MDGIVQEAGEYFMHQLLDLIVDQATPQQVVHIISSVTT